MKITRSKLNLIDLFYKRMPQSWIYHDLQPQIIFLGTEGQEGKNYVTKIVSILSNHSIIVFDENELETIKKIVIEYEKYSGVDMTVRLYSPKPFDE